ncbi:MAG: hypothetical protein IJZ26_01995 [Clostridia bacterium]|nr:hypothetical protein [Clostridia bacterium]
MAEKIKKEKVKKKKDNTKKQEAQLLKKQLKQQAKAREKELTRIHNIEMSALRENWYKLDNAALIYPAIGSSQFTSVFRISAELKNDVNPEVLQQTLEQTIKRFPIFNVSLANGLFWHYFQPLTKPHIIEEEKNYPCRPFVLNKNNAIFRVLYYKNKISFETFHSLTDGGGASQFFNCLLATYLKNMGVKIPETPEILNIRDKALEEEGEDAFKIYADKNQQASRKEKKAYFVKDPVNPMSVLQLIKGSASVGQVKQVAKSYDATINELLSAVYILAMLNNKKRYKRNNNPIKLSVPVNLRRHFPSKTLKNFSAVFNIELPVEQENAGFEKILELVKQQSAAIDKDYLLKFISTNVKSERNFFVRAMPLVVKDFALRIAYSFVGESLFTSTISNLGVMKLPQEIENELLSYYVSIGATKVNRFNLAVVSHGDTIEMCFSNRLKSTAIMRDFFSFLSGLGIDIVIESNF